MASAAPAVEAVGIKYPLVYDVTNEVPQRWDRFNNFGTKLADAAIYIIDKDGRLVWESVGEDYKHFVPASEIIDALDRFAG